MSLFGFLNCNKPVGMTSRDVVNIVQRRIRPIKVGHCGTLDPLAQGVLVLGVGPAVRLTQYVQQQEKRYLGTFRLGASSETGDIEKGYDEHPELPTPTLDDLQQAAKSLVGEITQVPPAYSAIWVDGQRAYRRARQGESFEVPSRTVSVYRLDITEYDFPTLKIDIACGSGTYVRTLGIDLATAAGSNAVMTDLVRTGVGPFQIDAAVTTDDLREQPLDQLIMSASMGIGSLSKCELSDVESDRVGHGLCIERDTDFQSSDQEYAGVTADGQLRAILKRKPRGLCPIRVFPI